MWPAPSWRSWMRSAPFTGALTSPPATPHSRSNKESMTENASPVHVLCIFDRHNGKPIKVPTAFKEVHPLLLFRGSLWRTCFDRKNQSMISKRRCLFVSQRISSRGIKRDDGRPPEELSSSAPSGNLDLVLFF